MKIPPKEIQDAIVKNLYNQAIMGNQYRPEYVEYMIRAILDDGCRVVSRNWNGWDLDYPKGSRLVRIEVKQAAAKQPWTDSPRLLGRKADRSYDVSTPETYFADDARVKVWTQRKRDGALIRPADLYIFAWHPEGADDQRRISSSEPDGSPEPLLEAARLGNKKVLCVDSMDRLPEGKEPVVRDFFKAVQGTLSKLRTISVVLFACGDTWGNYLASEELSYLGFRNQWSLPPFTPDEVQEMLDKRLRACGSSYLTVFEPGCTTILQTVSGGNPRRVLEKVEAICRLAAQKGEKRVTPAFIREEYEKDFDQAIERLLASLAASHKECAKAITSVYHFYLEMERRALSTSEGWNYLVELMETGLPLNKVHGSYRTALRYVSSVTATVGEFQAGAPAVLAPPDFLKQFFKELRKKGYSVRDFVAFYSTNPVVPGGKEDDLGLLLKSPPVMGPDVEYFEKARALFIATKRSTSPSFQVISDAWDCVEYMVYAILLKAEAPGVAPILAKRDSWLVPDRFGIPRFVRGAGKLRADHAFELTDYFSAWRKEKMIWMDTLPSLKWLRDERANVVRGRTEYLSRYGNRERDLALTHLDAVFKELSRIYG